MAGIDQLYSIAKMAQTDGTDASDLTAMGDAVGAVFIDEAHRSWAPKYRRVLRELGIGDAAGPHDRMPLIGLTATPEPHRARRNGTPTEALRWKNHPPQHGIQPGYGQIREGVR